MPMDEQSLSDAVNGLKKALAEIHEQARVDVDLGVNPETYLSARTLWAVVGFLQRWPELKDTGYLGPLESLVAALADLQSGTRSSLLQPRIGPGPMPTELQITMAKAAVTLDALLRIGTDETDAGVRVGEALRKAKLRLPPQYKTTFAKTVEGWRKRLMAGGVTVPQLAARAWDIYMKQITSEMKQGREIEPSSVDKMLVDLRDYVATHPILSPPRPTRPG